MKTKPPARPMLRRAMGKSSYGEPKAMVPVAPKVRKAAFPRARGSALGKLES